MNKLFSLTALSLFMSVFLFSCSHDSEDLKRDDDDTSKIEAKVNNQILKQDFSNLTADFDYLKTIDLLQFAEIQKVVEVFEVNDLKVNYDYAFVFDNKDLVYAEFNKSTNEIIITDYISQHPFKFKRITDSNGVIKVLDLESGHYLGGQVDKNQMNNMKLPPCSGTLMLCSATCVLATGAIAVSDGPLPFMDILAAATYIICNAHCASSYDDCMN